jgi:hypothetical protein
MGDITATLGMTSPMLEKVEEHQGENSSGSIASSPEAEGIEHDTPIAQEPGQQQKRKGGRKPVSADLYVNLRAVRARL